MPYRNKFVAFDGLRLRYIEDGTGPEVFLLHGASLGSSADVWERNLSPLASRGLRAIAFDLPGFGLSDKPADHSVPYRRRSIVGFMDALKIDKAHLVGHSLAGAMAVGLAFEQPRRIGKIVVLGTGSLLPPLPQGSGQAGPREGDEGGSVEPTLEDTRRLLEHNLFNHSLITPEALQKRHSMSVGENFTAFVERTKAQQAAAGGPGVPLWQRLDQVPVPVLMIYGQQDRGSAAERAALAKEKFPGLNLHVLDRCKHLLQWDCEKEFLSLTTEFLRP